MQVSVFSTISAVRFMIRFLMILNSMMRNFGKKIFRNPDTFLVFLLIGNEIKQFGN